MMVPLVDLLRITRMGPFLLLRSIRILPCPLRHGAVLYSWVAGLN